MILARYFLNIYYLLILQYTYKKKNDTVYM